MKHKVVSLKGASYKNLTTGKISKLNLDDTAEKNSKGGWTLYQVTESGNDLLLFFRK